MANFEDRLKKEIQLFIILLKKLKEQESNMGFMTEQDQMMLKSLDFVIQNYESMDAQFPPGITGDMMETYMQTLHYMTSMLMEELGDSGLYLTDEEQRIYNEVHNNSQDQLNIDKSLPIPTINQLLDKTDAAIPMKHRIMMAIQEIDQQITPNMDSNTADELLDRRLDLLDQLKQYS